MKLIIDIHEEQYKFIKQGIVMAMDNVIRFPALMESIYECIANGTPLENLRAKIEREADLHDAYVDQDIAKGLYLATRIIEDFTKGEPDDKPTDT